MPIIQAPSRPTHELPHARFWSLATPTRGSRELSVWRVQLAPSGEGASHSVTREEVLVILAGSVRVVLDGTLTMAGVGDAIVVPPDAEFVISSDEGAELLCCLPVGGQARLRGSEPFTPPWAK